MTPKQFASDCDQHFGFLIADHGFTEITPKLPTGRDGLRREYNGAFRVSITYAYLELYVAIEFPQDPSRAMPLDGIPYLLRKTQRPPTGILPAIETIPEYAVILRDNFDDIQHIAADHSGHLLVRLFDTSKQDAEEFLRMMKSER